MSADQSERRIVGRLNHPPDGRRNAVLLDVLSLAQVLDELLERLGLFWCQRFQILCALEAPIVAVTARSQDTIKGQSDVQITVANQLRVVR